ncbi:unnamed protein product, partial [Mesorhabditis belari]|uniref:Uncharacterized protein n=1 Tax=Mesorhabditis belari TaxID=2138241 RepID=A0AAF3J2T3_9BILA
MMSSQQRQQPQPNMGHRHSLTIETNPLHLLPSNVRRFSQVGELKGHLKPEILAKVAQNNGIPEVQDDEKKKDQESDK